MVLTCGDILDEARLALRHDLDERLNDIQFANRVGRRWIGLHPWLYLTGRFELVSLVAGQSSYPLPRDMAEIQAIYGDNTIIPLVRLVSWEHWHSTSVRDYGAVYNTFYGAVNHETRDGELVPVLHLAPTPSGVDTIRVVYRAGWKPLAAEADVADIPVFAEEAFRDLVRSMAIGLSRPSSGGDPDPLLDLVARVRQGDSFVMAMEQDGLIQPEVERGIGALGEAMLYSQMRGRSGPRSTNQDLLADL